MKNNRKWLRVVVCMLSAFVGAFAYTLRGIAEQIQMSQVLHTVYGFALVIGGISFILAMYYLGKSRADLCKSLSLLRLWFCFFKCFDDSNDDQWDHTDFSDI